jgi:8-oxo-dGTP pyrophosphatase MutT (NUDIX family)
MRDSLRQVIEYARQVQRLHVQDPSLQSGEVVLREILEEAGIDEDRIQHILPAILHCDTPFTLNLTITERKKS